MLNKALYKIIVFFIRAYRLILSPIFGLYCRFQPTCSVYALEALERHGTWRGLLLIVRRLGRCHPVRILGGSSGYDPVPFKDDLSQG